MSLMNNVVFLAGPVEPSSIRFYGNDDGRYGPFGFLNMEITGIPVVVKYSGESFRSSRVQALADAMKADSNAHAMIGGAYIQQRKAKDGTMAGWEVATKPGAGRFTYMSVPVESNYAYVYGRVTNEQRSSDGSVWVDLAIYYWSGQQGKGRRERTVRAVLRNMPDGIVGWEVYAWGRIFPRTPDGTKLLHVVSDVSILQPGASS